jgi:GT2 family glycosyltransferase
VTRGAAAGETATVGVVVATRDRPQLLDRCLAALAAQTRPADEIVVVDDASVDGDTAAAVRRYERSLPVRLVRRSQPGGPGRARQDGWPTLASAMVAFTDDDCRPSPGWLAALATEAAPGVVVVGPTLPDPEDGPLRSVFDRTMRIEAHDGRFSTCNALYPRALLEALGGFDLAFDGYGEDTDLGQRALRFGAQGRWVADALVWHAVHRPGAWRSLRQRRRVGEIVRLIRLHPQLRDQIWQGWFWKEQHYDLLIAVVASIATVAAPAIVLGTRRRGGDAPAGARQDCWRRELLAASMAAGAAALPHVVLPGAGRWLDHAPARVRAIVGQSRGGRTWMLGQVAGLALVDGVELASCAAGSLRHRTLFL